MPVAPGSLLGEKLQSCAGGAELLCAGPGQTSLPRALLAFQRKAAGAAPRHGVSLNIHPLSLLRCVAHLLPPHQTAAF